MEPFKLRRSIQDLFNKSDYVCYYNNENAITNMVLNLHFEVGK